MTVTLNRYADQSTTSPMSVPLGGRTIVRLVLFSLCFALLSPRGTYAASTLVIGEVAWAGSSLSTADEWVEVWNVSDEPISLAGYTLVGGSSSPIAFRSGDIIRPHATFLIANNSATDTKSLLNTPPDLVTTAVSLSNDALGLSLVDPSGTVIDRAGDGHTPPAGASTPIKKTMIRVSTLAPGDATSAWITATSSVNFKSGQTDLGTPGVCDNCGQAETDTVTPPVIDQSTSNTPTTDVAPPSDEPPVIDNPPASVDDTATQDATLEAGGDPSNAAAEQDATSSVDPSELALYEQATGTIDATTDGTADNPATTSTTDDASATVATTDTPPVQTPTDVATSTPLLDQTASSTSNVSPTTTADPITITSSTTFTTSTSSTALLTIEVATSSVSSTDPLHIQLALTLNVTSPAYNTINVPTEDHTWITSLVSALVKNKVLTMASATKITAAAKATTASPKKTTTSNATAPTKKTVVKKTTTKKTTVKKSSSTKSSYAMPISLDAAAGLAGTSPRVLLTGSVGSPPGLLAKNQFVLLAADGRGILVQGNGKQPSPHLNEGIRVEGTLVLNDNGLSLRMYAADRWTDTSLTAVAEPRVVDLLAPATEDEWSLIEVTGTVANVTKQSVQVDLEDTTVQMRVPSVVQYRTARLTKGDRVRVRGLMSSSQDTTILHPRTADEIILVEHPKSLMTSASTAQASSIPGWTPFGAAGATIAVAQGVKRIRKIREQQRLNSMLARAQEQLFTQTDFPSPLS